MILFSKAEVMTKVPTQPARSAAELTHHQLHKGHVHPARSAKWHMHICHSSTTIADASVSIINKQATCYMYVVGVSISCTPPVWWVHCNW